MLIYGLDPGTDQSAVIGFDGDAVLIRLWLPNDDMRKLLRVAEADMLVIEQMQNFGKVVGHHIHDTIFWAGRFAEIWEGQGRQWTPVSRRDVKQHLLSSTKGTDGDIRKALIARFGESEREAIGTPKAPGPLFGVKSHLWSALALAITYYETKVATQ